MFVICVGCGFVYYLIVLKYCLGLLELFLLLVVVVLILFVFGCKVDEVGFFEQQVLFEVVVGLFEFYFFFYGMVEVVDLFVLIVFNVNIYLFQVCWFVEDGI